MIESKRLTQLPESQALINQANRLLEQLQEALSSVDRQLPDSAWEPLLSRIFCCSPFVGKTMIASPEIAISLITEDLLKAFCIDRFDAMAVRLRDCDQEEEFMRLLRQLRQCEITRIALRDLLGWSALAETLGALSDLADFCITQAVERSYKDLSARFGTPISHAGEPQEMVVLAMGKLGGQELNYSSDIDIIFTYPEVGHTQTQSVDQSSIENQKFFNQQAQHIIKFLHQTTADGFVFRVDARLRPFGDSGPLAVSFDFMESYYQHQGRDWERYAMIKARPLARLPADAEYLMKMLHPFIYRRYLDYGAFAALRDMKSLIIREKARKGLERDVKLGSGGIREVEFIAQAFQLVRGGREPALRSRQLIPTLQALAAGGQLQPDVVEQLVLAYRFLRDTENRLQMVADQQTHYLPKDEIEQERLAFSMGFSGCQSFNQQLNKHRQVVQNCFGDIVFGEKTATGSGAIALQLMTVMEGKMEPAEAIQLIEELGYENAELIVADILKFGESHLLRGMSELSRKRLTDLLEPLFKEMVGKNEEQQTVARVLKVLQAIVQRSVYIVLLSENYAALQLLVKLCSASRWVAEYISEQPILLDRLLDPRLLYELPDREQLCAQLDALMDSLEGEDFEQQLNALRHFKQEQILRVVAVDLNAKLPLMKVSDQLTWLAEAILNRVYAAVYREMITKYGKPRCEVDGSVYEPELAVIGYGKLGSIELGYSSDLDLVFVHNSAGPDQDTDGSRPLPNQVFFMRLAQRMIHLLNTPTAGGILYEIDIRLRPDGASGLLVNSLEGFSKYTRTRAWTWEHQALVRTRILVGSSEIARAFEVLRQEILTEPRDRIALCNEVKKMRNRMREELVKSKEGEFDLKQSRGGIADIEFIVQYGVLAWAQTHPGLTQYTDNIRVLEQFGREGLLDKDDASKLISAYKYLRSRVHRLALQGEVAVLKDFSDAQEHIDAVVNVWNQLMEAN